MLNKQWYVVLLAGLFTANAFASSLFKLNDESLNPREKAAVLELLLEADQILPDTLKQSLKKPIEIAFSDLNPDKPHKSLPKDRCLTSTALIYGTTGRTTLAITLDNLLLPEIVKGEEGSATFNCGHKNYYRLALATILHEVAHVYDHKSFGKTAISGDKSFFKLADWKRNILLQASSKNKSHKRSVDPYEFKNLDEHYAVNFEYFLLDPEYRCKRPSYYKFFQNHFKQSPNAHRPCKINSVVRLDDNKAVIDIAPDRVYRVDYLLASKGDEMISGFGHSMFRLIVCAPFRKTVSAECLKDKLYHVVLSYRANVTDIKSNPLKGLAGKYDSVLFMLSFPKVIEEYNMAELRDLYSIPLNFSNEQKERFIHKTLETYWEYVGSYKFLSANCASESNELLQAALNNHDIINDSIVKPYSLWELLLKHKLTDIADMEDEEQFIKKGLLFQSDAKRLAEIKTRLFGDDPADYETKKQLIPSPKGPDKVVIKKTKKHIKDILSRMTAEEFMNRLEQIDINDISLETKNAYHELSILAQAALTVQQHEIDELIGDYLEKIENEPTALGQSVRNWNLKRKNFRLSPLKDDYGIPLEITDADFENYKTETELLEKTEMDLVNNVKDRYSHDVEVMLGIKEVITVARNKGKIISMQLYLKQ